MEEKLARDLIQWGPESKIDLGLGYCIARAFFHSYIHVCTHVCTQEIKLDAKCNNCSATQLYSASYSASNGTVNFVPAVMIPALLPKRNESATVDIVNMLHHG